MIHHNTDRFERTNHNNVPIHLVIRWLQNAASDQLICMDLMDLSVLPSNAFSTVVPSWGTMFLSVCGRCLDVKNVGCRNGFFVHKCLFWTGNTDKQNHAKCVPFHISCLICFKSCDQEATNYIQTTIAYILNSSPPLRGDVASEEFVSLGTPEDTKKLGIGLVLWMILDDGGHLVYQICSSNCVATITCSSLQQNCGVETDWKKDKKGSDFQR